MTPIVWEALARREYEDGLSVSPDPVEYQRAVEDALQNIASGITSHARFQRTPARQCILTTPPYSIIYVESDDEIRVWAFPHHKQKPGYWKKRLPRS